MARLRRELPQRFPELQFFFQPADIVDQVLNFGQPAPIDIRISGPHSDEAYALASKLAHDLQRVPGIVDSHVFQVPDAPTLDVNVDRALATQMGLQQRSTANDVLISTNSSAQSAPNFWVDPRNQVSYPLVVQLPTYHIDSTHDLWTMPLTSGSNGKPGQMLMNVASFSRGTAPLVLSQLNIRPVFDVDADVQGRDLYSAASDIDKVLAADRPDSSKAISVVLSGQVETMRDSYAGLFSGMALAVILVYLFLVINFQSWLDPLIVLMAVPFALGGVMWMLYLTGTHLSVPALMGTLMCIGLTTANSILVVTFANQRMTVGDDAGDRCRDRRLHPPAPGVDDGRGNDAGHGSHGAGDRRGRGAECAAGARCHRRIAVRHLRHAGVCTDRLSIAATWPPGVASCIGSRRPPCNPVTQDVCCSAPLPLWPSFCCLPS